MTHDSVTEQSTATSSLGIFYPVTFRTFRGVAFILTLLFSAVLSAATASAQNVVYDAVPSTLAPNHPSLGFEATQTVEFGDFVHLSGINRRLNSVTVTMSAWGKNSEYPSMPAGTWNHPITLNIYTVGPVVGGLNTKGSLIGTVTQTKSIPWRPEADITCSGGTAWRSPVNMLCYNGLAFNLTFDMSSLGVILPNDLIVSVAYNTQSYGSAPIGVAGPYNSLNVGAIAGPASIGTDDNLDRVFWNTGHAPFYADGGTGGVGILREDTAWAPNGNVPIQITTAPATLIVDDNLSCPGSTFNTIGAAVAAALAGDIIQVCSGTYVPAPTTNINKANLTIVGVGPTKPVVQTSGFNYLFLVTASGVTLDNLEIQKTDAGTTTPHNMIGIQGSNFTAQNNLIYGINPGTPWSVNGIVSRAFEVSGGLTGILIQNNTIRNLRQPAYMNSSTGSILNNNVSGTRGWVVDGAAALYTFNGNTWGPPQNQGCDIALINATVLANYTPLLALSSNNSNAYICSSGIGGPNGRATAYVDKTPSLGGGSEFDDYTTIQEGIDGALPGGTVLVSAGTYVEEININKQLSVLGPNSGINPNTGSRVAEAIIQPSVSEPTYASGTEMVIISAENVVFDGFTVDGDNPALTSGVVFNGADVNAGYGIINNGTANPRATVRNNIVKNIGEFGIFLYGNASGGAANSTIQNNKVDNIPGQLFGHGIHIRDNAYANVTDNVVTRVGLGIVAENFFNAGAAPATIGNNQVSAHTYGIRHNAHYSYTTNGFTISNNTIGSYVESFVRATPPVRFNGIRIESIQGLVPATFSGNTITPDRAALVGNGYSRVDGIFITNPSTNSPNIVITGNTVSNALRGISHTTPAVLTVTCNLLTNNETGIYVGTDIGFGGTPSSSTNGINISQNNIVGNSSFGVQNDSAFVTNAANNFWGSNTGPGGSNNPVSANVNAIPFLAAASGCAALPAPVSISGTVSPALAGVTITLSGDQAGSTMTDASGNYSFTGLTSAGNYLITPSLAGYSFDPINRSYSDVTTNITNANFTRFTGGSARLISVVSQNVVPGANAVVPITVISQGNENSFGFSLSYDPAVLSGPTVGLGTDCADCTLIVNNTTPGVVGIVIAKPSNQAVAVSPPARQLVTVTFATSATPPAFSTPVTFGDSPVVRAVADTNADPLAASYASGAVTFATGFESDVAPRNNGSNTGIINAGDYTQTGRFVAGLDVVNPMFNEFQRADAAPRASKGSGSINAGDLTQAGRYAAGLDSAQTVGGPTVASFFSNEALVERHSTAKVFKGARTINAVDKNAARGNQVVVSVEVAAQGDESSIGFTLSYDQAVLSNPVVTVGSGMPGALFVNTSTHPGRIGIVNGLPVPSTLAAGTRQVVTIRFDVSATAPVGPTPLTMINFPPTENFISDEFGNELPTSFNTGFVNVQSSAPTASTASVGGLITSLDGRGLSKARVTMTDSNGVARTVLSNAFGYYRFDEVLVGGTYVLTATAKRHTFASQTVSVTDQITGLNMIAEQ